MQPYRLYGVNASPYSIKVRAILRYRRLPFVWDRDSDAREVARAAGLPPVIPVLRFPDGTVLNDSTPLAHELERRHPDARSIVPADPAAAFLSDLIEDMADEWLTKIMFHYRWYYEADRRFAQIWVMGDRMVGRPAALRADAMQTFNDRQVGRMALVGCTDENRPILEASYRTVLQVLDRLVVRQPFLFGARPSLGDFGLFGQLQILATDPTSAAAMRAQAPNVLTWLMRLDDASGVEGDSADPGAPFAPGIAELLLHAAETYLPFMAANAAALGEGRDSVEVMLLGQRYRQAPFRYQAKCWDVLRLRFAALPGAARERVDPILRETGCLLLLQ